MKCEDVNINMFDLLEGSLNRDAEKELREHIDLCEACKSQLSFIEGALGQIEVGKKINVSTGFGDEILAKLKHERKPITLTRKILAPVAAAAVVVFGIFTGIFISDLSSGNSSDMYADLPDEYYYTNEIHLETIEGFFLTNED